MKFFRTQWFSVAMIGLFGLAWLMPRLTQAVNPHDWTKTGAIVAIFLVSGLSLRTEDSIRAIGAWRLHLFIQGFGFLFVPLLCWIIVGPLARTLPEGLVMGLYLLAVVPTTITSCVVFTQLAGGNTAGALFNAVAGNLAGIFISPALLLLMLGASHLKIELDAWGIFFKLCNIVLMPFLIGQIFHAPLARRWPSFRKLAAHINRAGVLLIIYLAFGDVFTRDTGALLRPSVVIALVLLVPAHLFLLWASSVGAKLTGFSREDRLAILFCAPQKTLSLGLPMTAAVLANRPELIGLASLPILVYHPVQLLVGGLLQEHFRASVLPEGGRADVEVSKSDPAAEG